MARIPVDDDYRDHANDEQVRPAPVVTPAKKILNFLQMSVTFAFITFVSYFIVIITFASVVTFAVRDTDLVLKDGILTPVK